VASVTEESEYDYWVGERYREHGYRGVHLLVLGESSHGSSDADEKAVSPRTLVKAHIEYRSGHWGRTYTQFLQVLTGDRPIVDRGKIWAELAFHNFLQCWAAENAKTAPTEANWANPANMTAFRHACATLRPDAVIVWGLRLWDNLATRYGCLVPEGDDRGHVKFDGNAAPVISAFCMAHPWTPRMTFEIWSPRIRQFLDQIAVRKD
jgi:hypothetical protein